MKEVSLLLMLLALCGLTSVLAQNFSEWFKQKKTQIKYLEKQILALQVYKEIVEKGYQEARDGTSLIGSIKEEDLGLHEQHYGDLQRVKPAILQNLSLPDAFQQINEIKEVAEEVRVMTASRKSLVFDWSRMGVAYANYINEQCYQLEDYLIGLSTDGRLKMTDEERLSAIYRVQKWLLEKHHLVFENKVTIEEMLKARGL